MHKLRLATNINELLLALIFLMEKLQAARRKNIYYRVTLSKLMIMVGAQLSASHAFRAHLLAEHATILIFYILRFDNP